MLDTPWVLLWLFATGLLVFGGAVLIDSALVLYIAYQERRGNHARAEAARVRLAKRLDRTRQP